jgi:2,3-bisphosphoglycerate-dependent phosphoglycerate mutase
MILPALKNNKNILITAHGNSLRALVKMLDDISEEEITEFNIPTGVPILYHLDEYQKPLSREFLGDPKSIAKAMQSVANQANDN